MKCKYLFQGLFIALVALLSFSGVQAQNVITMTTDKNVGDVIILFIETIGHNDVVQIDGVEGTYKQYQRSYKLTSPTVKITGNIKKLKCYSNKLTQLDITKNSTLEELNCSFNQLTQFDITKNTALKELYCSSNQLTQLDITKNTMLERLECYSNQLTQLDVTKNTALKNLKCYSNQLTQLDVTKNTALKRLECQDNQLTQLDVTKNTHMEDLYCYSNHLTQLDVAKNTKLEILYCQDNQLTQLDVTKNTRLGYLNCSSNKLTQLDVTKNKSLGTLNCSYNQLTKLDVTKNSGLYTIKCSSNKLTQLDVEKNSTLYTFDCSSNQLTHLDITKNKGLGHLNCSSNKLTQLDVMQNTGLVTLTCSSSELTQLDVTKNTQLESLTCTSNQLTQLDITNNTKLKEFDCSSNQLTQLNIMNNTALKEFDCSSNQLTQLDITNNTALMEFDCSSNQLTQLDITNNTKLKELDCSSNQLMQLDISKNLKLVNLSVHSNKIENESMARLVKDLPRVYPQEGNKENEGYFIAIDTKNSNEKNLLSKATAEKAKSKNWKVRTFNGGKDNSGKNDWRGIPYEGEKKLYAITTEFNSAEGNIRLSVADSEKVLEDTEVEVTVQPNEGYELGTLMANSEDITATRKFTVKGNTKVVATFRKQTFAVTAENVTNGTLTLSGYADMTKVPYGTAIKVAATPAEGHMLASLTANGVDIMAKKEFVVKGATKVEATFAIQTFAVTAENATNGTLTLSGYTDMTKVPYGTTIKVVATPAEGYMLATLTTNGIDIVATKEFVVKNATKVEATFAIQTFAVTLPQVEHAKLSIKGNPDLTKVPYGTELELEVLPEKGFLIGEVRINDKIMTAPYEFVVKGDVKIEVDIKRDIAIETIEVTPPHLYPNPATTYIRVEGIAEGTEVRLLTVGGRVVLTDHLDNSGRLDVSFLKRDIYLLQIGSENYTVVLK